MTNISLGDRFSAYVRQQVEAGHFANVSEVVRDALRLHEHETRMREAKLDALRAGLDDAAASLDRGAGRHRSVEAIMTDADRADSQT